MARNDCPPDEASYGAAITACRSSMHWQQVLELLRESREFDVSPDLGSVSAALEIYSRAMCWWHALDLLNASVILLPSGLGVAAWYSVISACVHSGQGAYITHLSMAAMTSSVVHPIPVFISE